MSLSIYQLMLGFSENAALFAHPHHELHTHVPGFETGFLHPLLGIDHLLAMVTVGVLAARAGGKTVWLLPLSFLTCMAFGGYFGMLGMRLWQAEAGIALSVVLLGTALAAGRNLSTWLLLAACGLFGFVHGQAHGAEMPSMAQPAMYAAGFVLATALLHGEGILLGYSAVRSVTRQHVLRFSGVAVALAGIALLFTKG